MKLIRTSVSCTAHVFYLIWSIQENVKHMSLLCTVVSRFSQFRIERIGMESAEQQNGLKLTSLRPLHLTFLNDVLFDQSKFFN